MWTQYANELHADQLRFALSKGMNFTASLVVDVAKTLRSYHLSTRADEWNSRCFSAGDVFHRCLLCTVRSMGPHSPFRTLVPKAFEHARARESFLDFLAAYKLRGQ